MMYGLETTGSGLAGFTGSSLCRLGSVIDCLLEEIAWDQWGLLARDIVL